MAYIDNLVLEVTRRCQMKCRHCLRGGAQRIDMPYEVAYRALSSFSSIHCLTLTGGEPALNIDLIDKILDILIYGNTKVDSVFIVTNGIKYLGDDVMRKLGYLYNMSYDNELFGIAVSNDQYHQEFASSRIYNNIERYQNYDFYRGLRGKILSDQALLAEGRASTLGHRDASEYDDIEEYMDGRYTGLLYVNALGKVMTGCDYSYNTQKKKEVCTYDKINDFLLSCPKSEDFFE